MQIGASIIFLLIKEKTSFADLFHLTYLSANSE